MADLEGFDQGLGTALGMRTVSASGDRVVLEWTADERHLQPFGIVHGGAYCTAHETAASIGGHLWLGERGYVVGVSNLTDFLRPSRAGDQLSTVGTPVHRGRLQQLWLMETRDREDRLIARGQVRLQNLDTIR